MSIDDQVEALIAERPGKELMVPRYDDPAHPITPFLYRSGGTTAAYCLLTEAGRIIVNTGLGYEAPHHKRVFDQVRPGPTPYIITTQGHVDHLGGVALFREPETLYVAQANNLACQHDDARIRDLRMRTAGIWFDMTGSDAIAIARQNPGVPQRQDTPIPDVTFDRRLSLVVDGLSLELLATVGETVDSLIVWLPEHRIALISNLLGPLFPHFPNLNTLRGDRYRFVEPYLESVALLRSLEPDMLVTGRYEPIVGAELIAASLSRLHQAVDWVHQRTLEGINAGTDLATLMEEIRLPSTLAVGQGYGKVSWAVRTIWESYLGWFKLRSTAELYPDPTGAALASIIRALGAEGARGAARRLLEAGEPAAAVVLGEALLALDPEDTPTRSILTAAHQRLLDRGGRANFWESGWLEHELGRLGEPGPSHPV